MGRPRKPTAQLKLQGSFREDRHGDRSHDPRPDGDPVRPDDLDQEASRLWDFIVPQLVEIGAAKAVDTPMLHGMCIWWSRYRSAQDAGGMEYRRIVMASTAWKQFSAIASKFGLTPCDRARLKLERPEDMNDPLAAYLRSRNTGTE